MNSRADLLSDALHRRAMDACDGIVWLALDGRAPDKQATSALRQGLLAREAVPVRLSHPQMDERLYPAWYRLDANRSTDSALLRLSVEIALDELDPQVLRQGGGRVLAGWLALPGSVPPGEVASHLGRQMIQRRHMRTLLLRLHDPAVLWWLWQWLDAAQRAALLGRMNAWWLLSPLGELHALERPSGAGVDTLALGERQWRDVFAIASLNQVLRSLDAPPDGQTLRMLHDAARRACEHGLTDTDDQAAFIRHSLQMHPQFDRHPLLQSLLQRRQPGEFYAALSAELDDAAWRQVQHDCTTLPPSA